MRKRSEIDIFLEQHSAMPHTSSATTDAVARLGFTIHPHPAYTHYLAPSNFHLFLKLKKTSVAKLYFLLRSQGYNMPVVSEERERQNLKMEFKSLP